MKEHKGNKGMKEHKIKIRIIPTDYSDKPLNSKKSFWSYVSHKTEKESNFPEKLEYTFKKKFARELKQKLKNKFQKELRDFENNYNINIHSPYLEEYFHYLFRKGDIEEKYHFDDFVNGIAKLQELKNNYFKDNTEYQKLLNKNILATQIDFGVNNISYSSLGFDLNIEPFEKAIELFDNNFELFRIFLDQYIPETFLSSLSINNDNLPITTSIDFPQTFKDEFERPLSNEKTPDFNQKDKQKITNKWDKAKWIWSLTNGSLVVPVILALLILYITFNKIESVFKIRQENYKEINSN